MEQLQQAVFSTKQVSGNDGKIAPVSQIFLNGMASDKSLVGACLEACFKTQTGYLVFMTENCPFEETLDIHLLDEHLNVLDSASLFWPYNTGKFRLLKKMEPNIVTFKFFDSAEWMVRVEKTKITHIPFFSEPKGVFRKLTLSRHFTIRKKI